MSFIKDNKYIIEDGESNTTKYKIHGSMLAAELEAGNMFGRGHKFKFEMAKLVEPSSTLTNMRILDEVHVNDIYFDFNDTHDQFECMLKSWLVENSNDEKLYNMMLTIM